MPETPKEHTFETAMARLNALVGTMESDELTLDALLESYEEGVRLVKMCQSQLATAQLRLEIIQQNAAKELETKPFDPASAKAETTRPAAKDVSLF
jgi:exodeoxyribonuclease VII small subunit